MPLCYLRQEFLASLMMCWPALQSEAYKGCCKRMQAQWKQRAKNSRVLFNPSSLPCIPYAFTEARVFPLLPESTSEGNTLVACASSEPAGTKLPWSSQEEPTHSLCFLSWRESKGNTLRLQGAFRVKLPWWFLEEPTHSLHFPSWGMHHLGWLLLKEPVCTPHFETS